MLGSACYAGPTGRVDHGTGGVEPPPPAGPDEFGGVATLTVPCDPSVAGQVQWKLEEARPWTAKVDWRWCAEDSPSSPAGSDRIFALDLPPGATWDEDAGWLRFTPDFTQGGRRYTVELVFERKGVRTSVPVVLDVADSISPPPPSVVSTTSQNGIRRWVVSQTTDDYLDAPGHAGRTFEAVVVVPEGSPPVDGWPVRVALHGFATASPNVAGWREEIRIAPHDPDDTYWWGYGETLPDAVPGPDDAVPDYTARRVVALVDWVLHEVDGADPERVYLTGSSMGGAGALTIGIEHARHFAWVRAELAQTVPRLHRAARIAQLEQWWGVATAQAVWSRQDSSRRIAAGDADDVLVFVRHAKDDPAIRFSAAVGASPDTGLAFYEALQAFRVAHAVIWDEGGHGTPDPVLGARWWDVFSAIHDPDLSVRRDRAVIAFSNAAHDDDPGLGSAGDVGDDAVPGDTGWPGDLAGGWNRHLRWRGASIVDTIDRFEVELRVQAGQGTPPPGPRYPATGDRVEAPRPIAVDVTPRRLSAFRCRAGEPVVWHFGELEGTTVADETGTVTIEQLPLGDDWQRLVITRMAAP